MMRAFPSSPSLTGVRYLLLGQRENIVDRSGFPGSCWEFISVLKKTTREGVGKFHSIFLVLVVMSSTLLASTLLAMASNLLMACK